jgi:hypothetical protein
VPQIPYFDNSECLQLLRNQPGGLIYNGRSSTKCAEERYGRSI